jgi:primosomal protein N' (replication factor Y)
VPEIALTGQLVKIFSEVFGDQVVVMHSQQTEAERHLLFDSLLFATKPIIVIGPRSALFAPVDNLGLIIIDEEHETTYKQFDSQPKYNARDCALVLAAIHGAKTLLGSATPSFESYYNATTGKYGLVELSNRFSDTQMPEIELVNTLQAQRKGLMKSLFSQTLLTRIAENLEQKKQIWG